MKTKFSAICLLVFLASTLSATILVAKAVTSEPIHSTVTDPYSNGLPGQQGERHSQAVQCGGGGWVIKAGCCYGWEECYNMNPCNGRSFSCDGLTYMALPETGIQ